MSFVSFLLGVAVGAIFAVPIIKLVKWVIDKITKKTDELKSIT